MSKSSAEHPAVWSTRPIPLAELPAGVQRACAGESLERQRMVLAIVTDTVRRSGAVDLFGLDAVHHAEIHPPISAIAVRSAADAATLLAIGPRASVSGSGLELGILLDELHDRLRAAGVRFVQAMRDPEDSQSLLARHGYQPLAVLDYMVAGHRRDPIDAQRPAGHLEPYRQWFVRQEDPATDPDLQLQALLDATYAGSMDCPAIASLRSTADLLASYRRHAGHREDWWQVLVDHRGTAIGCLLMTPHAASSILEITYMGLRPEYRGLGYARLCIDQCWRTAAAAGMLQLTLAVDRKNSPANRVYQRHGFEPLMSESVWGRGL